MKNAWTNHILRWILAKQLCDHFLYMKTVPAMASYNIGTTDSSLTIQVRIKYEQLCCQFFSILLHLAFLRDIKFILLINKPPFLASLLVNIGQLALVGVDKLKIRSPSQVINNVVGIIPIDVNNIVWLSIEFLMPARQDKKINIKLLPLGWLDICSSNIVSMNLQFLDGRCDRTIR